VVLMQPKKISRAVLFNVLSLLAIVLSIVIISFIFFISLRQIASTQITTLSRESAARMSDQVSAIIASHVALLEHTVIGSIPYMREDPVDRDALSRYFDDMQATLDRVMMIYATNNLGWNESGGRGYCAASTGWIPEDSWNNLERSWYKDAKKNPGVVVFTAPYIDAATGKLVFTMARTVFDQDRRDLGVVSQDVSIATLGSILKELSHLPQQQSFLLTPEGRFITNDDESAVMTEDFFTELGLEAYRQGVLSAPSFAEMTEVFFIAASRIPKADWILVSLVPRRVIFAEANRVLSRILIIGTMMLIFACITAVMMARSISRPIQYIAAILAEVREGEMTKRLDFHSKDKIGEMAASFNTTLDKIQKLIMDIKKQAFALSTMGQDMASSAKETNTTAHEQAASVSEILSTMEGSKQLSEQMAGRTAEVARLSADTQELSQQGAELRDANEQMMEDIQSQNGKIIRDIKQVVDMIKHINDAIGIIDGIADQTKLIAFNAALEASSSGESGARFSVVASEIRRFADNVADSTRGIKLRIAEVQTASRALISEALEGSRKIEVGYEHMSAQKAVFESIVETAQTVATRSAQISNLSKQQEYASAQIFEALKEISTGVEQVVSATASTSETADALSAMSTGLQQAIAKYRTGGPAS
jgi:methyl-accepting chemotaxis protein